MRSAESTTFGYFAIKMRIKSIRVKKDFKLPLKFTLNAVGKAVDLPIFWLLVSCSLSVKRYYDIFCIYPLQCDFWLRI